MKFGDVPAAQLTRNVRSNEVSVLDCFHNGDGKCAAEWKSVSNSGQRHLKQYAHSKLVVNRPTKPNLVRLLMFNLINTMAGSAERTISLILLRAACSQQRRST
jgi:hypothetical protein